MKYLAYPLLLLVVFCTVEPITEQENFYQEPLLQGEAFVTIDGTENYQQTVYLDTLESYTYTKVFGESTDMLENQKYNGEANIRASFSTDKYWEYSGGVFEDYPVYYVYPFSVRFVEPSPRYDYQPQKLELYTQQMIGPIPKSAIKNNETVKIYMEVSYDGLYKVEDSILIQLSPK